MKSIFEGAYFGKPYKTRDGRKAIYSYCIKGHDNEHYLIVDNNPSLLGGYNDDGIINACGYQNASLDIISEWQEPINGEGLDGLAKEYEYKSYGYSVDLENDLETDCSNQQNIIDIHEAFKAGYRKALEHKEVPSFNEAAKMWDLCDAYSCLIRNEGWTWEGAVKYIQEHWNDKDFNMNYEKFIEQ